jgi:hypothetical protein
MKNFIFVFIVFIGVVWEVEGPGGHGFTSPHGLSSHGFSSRMTVVYTRLGRAASLDEARLPSGVRGPVDVRALARLACV